MSLTLALDHNDVWICAIPCADPPVPPEELQAVLSVSERARLQRFRTAADRQRGLVSRGMLRWILSAQIGECASALMIKPGVHGKPELADAGDLAFNVSHSGDWVLLSLARGRPVGVDVERERPLSEIDALMERTLAPEEVCVLRALPDVERLSAFFSCWTCKEAFAKATGAGLMLDFATFTLPPLVWNGDAHATTHVAGMPGDWTFWRSAPEEGYAAAMATPATGIAVRACRWSGRGGLRSWSSGRSSGAARATPVSDHSGTLRRALAAKENRTARFQPSTTPPGR